MYIGEAKERGSMDLNLRIFLRESGSRVWIDKLDREEECIVHIQRIYKGHKTRIFVEKMREEYIQASLTIQRLARGAIGRKEAYRMNKERLNDMAMKYLKTLLYKTKRESVGIWRENATFQATRKRLRR